MIWVEFSVWMVWVEEIEPSMWMVKLSMTIARVFWVCRIIKHQQQWDE